MVHPTDGELCTVSFPDGNASEMQLSNGLLEPRSAVGFRFSLRGISAREPATSVVAWLFVTE
jgi:hypothetical protein